MNSATDTRHAFAGIPLIPKALLESSDLLQKQLFEAISSVTNTVASVRDEMNSDEAIARRRMWALLDAMIDATFMVSSTGEILESNDAAVELFGSGWNGRSISMLPVLGNADISTNIRHEARSFYVYTVDNGVGSGVDERREAYRKFKRAASHAKTTFTSVLDNKHLDLSVSLINPDASFPKSFVYFLVFRDVTSQHAAQERIHDLMRFQSTLLKTLPSPVFYTDSALRFSGYNDAFTALVELDSSYKLDGKPLHYAFNEPPASEILAILEQVKSTHVKAEACELRFNSPSSGRAIHIAMYAAPLLKAGEFVGCVCTLVDLSSLYSVKALQGTLLESVPSPVFYVDSNLNITTCNSQFEEALGIPKQDMLGRSLDALLHDDGLLDPKVAKISKALAASDRDLQKGLPSHRFDCQLFNVMTRTFNSYQACRVSLLDGKAFSGILTIMTETGNLNELHMIKNSMVDAIPLPAFFKDSTLRYARANKAFADWFGLSKSDVVGSTWDMIVSKALSGYGAAATDALNVVSENDDRMYSMKEQSQMIQIDLPCIKTGTVKRVAIYRRSLVYEGRFIGIVGTIFDMTELKCKE